MFLGQRDRIPCSVPSPLLPPTPMAQPAAAQEGAWRAPPLFFRPLLASAVSDPPRGEPGKMQERQGEVFPDGSCGVRGTGRGGKLPLPQTGVSMTSEDIPLPSPRCFAVPFGLQTLKEGGCGSVHLGCLPRRPWAASLTSSPSVLSSSHRSQKHHRPPSCLAPVWSVANLAGILRHDPLGLQPACHSL